MSITNKSIINAYKTAQNIPLSTPLYTYAAWRSMGYRVRKGEKCKHRVQMWKYTEKTAFHDGETKKVGRCFSKITYLFEAEQVERMV